MFKYSKPCPFCESPVTRKVGFTKNTGYQRYKCDSCGKCCSDSPLPAGSLPHGDEPKPKSVTELRLRKARNEKKKALEQIKSDSFTAEVL